MYEAYYGFSGKPFQLSPDPDFFYDSRGHHRAMAYLEYGLHQGEGFIVITGEIGAGKTTLVQRLLQRLPASDIVPAQIVTTQLEADDLIRIVASSFGLPSDSLDKSTLLIRLEHYFGQLQTEGRRALLIVDEAQNLGSRAIEELRMLSNFQFNSRATLQSFLIGQPELRDLMQRPEMRQLKQRVIAAYHLGPLDQSESRSYIEHRLVHVGWKSDPTFEDAAFERIFALTGGVPRRINTLVDRWLLSGYLADKHHLSAQDVVDVFDELEKELGSKHGYPKPGNRESPDIGRDGAVLNGHRYATEAFAALEERVEMLESTTSVMRGTLKKILRRLRRQASDREQP